MIKNFYSGHTTHVNINIIHSLARLVIGRRLHDDYCEIDSIKSKENLLNIKYICQNIEQKEVETK